MCMHRTTSHLPDSIGPSCWCSMLISEGSRSSWLLCKSQKLVALSGSVSLPSRSSMSTRGVATHLFAVPDLLLFEVNGSSNARKEGKELEWRQPLSSVPATGKGRHAHLEYTHMHMHLLPPGSAGYEVDIHGLASKCLNINELPSDFRVNEKKQIGDHALTQRGFGPGRIILRVWLCF
jgi:hypothetical protein